MKKLPSLNGLRAISITIVILFHLFRFNIRLDQDTMLRIPLFNGRFGVNVFFVISGFLITSLLLNEEEQAGSISLRNFYSRRVLRIFPAYFFLLFVYFILQSAGYLHIPGMAWLTALTYTKYLSYGEFYISHAWSLSIEENFYLFWPMVFLAGDKVRKDVATYLILIVPLIRLFIYYNPLQWVSEQSIFIRIDSIATGCYIALYRKEILARLDHHWNRCFYGSLFAIFLVPWLSYLCAGTYLRFVFVLFGELTGTIANVAIAIIMLYSVYGPKGGWHKLLNSKAFNYVGILSYSLYLWQQIYIAKKGWWVTHFPQNIILIFLTAMFSYYVIERPFLRLKSRFARKKEKVRRSLTTFPRTQMPQS
jgi:peptidoglycan/LPS O-acetylase OafA/YrhL